ncbi:MAG: MFS transporter [Alphaproteobacteria bacterium]|nr:MFS transporter [Alphaproteobacteria bacterium]
MDDKRPSRYGRSPEPRLGARSSTGKPARHRPSAQSSGKSGERQDRAGRTNGGRAQTAGLLSRYLALTILESVIRDQKTLDTAIPKALSDERFAGLSPRDRAFARLLAMTVLRRHANLQAIVGMFLSKPLAANADRIRLILLAGTAELTLLAVPPHAAISTAVELTRLSVKTRHFDKLANAILRRVANASPDILAAHTLAEANFPSWMIAGWQAAYGRETAQRIAEASLSEAALDITPKEDPIGWSARLEAIVLPTGSLRRPAGGRVEDLDGYAEGGWWVQDAAAALPVSLLAGQLVENTRVLDLCAAPGGKTAQLCTLGADITAVEVSETRMQRLLANLDRLGFNVRHVAADATTWRSLELFDAVLIDAPCTATGTIRRHPDILHLKRSDDAARLADMQSRLLRNAASLVTVGGTLVYCTCSLEAAECEDQIEGFLANPGAAPLRFARRPISPSEIGHQADWITPQGDLRTLPFHLPHENPALTGIDGFYVARLTRLG